MEGGSGKPFRFQRHVLGVMNSDPPCFHEGFRAGRLLEVVIQHTSAIPAAQAEHVCSCSVEVFECAVDDVTRWCQGRSDQREQRTLRLKLNVSTPIASICIFPTLLQFIPIPTTA